MGLITTSKQIIEISSGGQSWKGKRTPWSARTVMRMTKFKENKRCKQHMLSQMEISGKKIFGKKVLISFIAWV